MNEEEFDQAVEAENAITALTAERDALKANIEAINAAAQVAFVATTDPIMTDTLAAIGQRCADALGKKQP